MSPAPEPAARARRARRIIVFQATDTTRQGGDHMDDHSSSRDPMTGAEMSPTQPEDSQTRSASTGGVQTAGGAQTGGTGTGDSERGGGRDARGRGGDGRGGRVNTSAWLIGILVVLVAVFAGLRYAGRTPSPSRPAPTRPAPSLPTPTPAPTPTPTPTPTAPAPTLADLKRDLTNTESAISRRDWTAANTQAASVRARWQSLRSRVRSTDTTRDVTAFDSRLQKLTDSIKARNEADARADVTELKSLANRFEVAPTRSSTAG